MRRLPRVVDVQHQNVLGAHPGQVVHDQCNLLRLNHGADSHPAILVEHRHRRGPLTRRYLGSLGQTRTLDIVLAQDKSLRRDDTTDARGDELHHVRVRGRFRFNEHSSRLDNRIDGFEPGCPHGLAGFYAFRVSKMMPEVCWGGAGRCVSGLNKIRRTNKIDNALGHAKGARRLDTPAQLHNLGAQLPGPGRGL